VCSKCEVRLECLDFAITTRQQEGIWGGLNPKERQRLRRRVA
jgi:WhiB family redox-sensing transcriptional regulator